MGPVLTFINHNFASLTKLSRWGFNAGVYLTICGFFSGLFTVSLGMIMMGSASLLYVLTKPAQRRFAVRNFYTPFWYVLIFLSVITAFAGSENLALALTRIRVNLGILLIPLIVLGAPPFSNSAYQRWVFFGVLAACIAAFAVIINYLWDYTEINHGLGSGVPLPTPVNHIRFSMMMAFAALAAFYLSFRKSSLQIWMVICSVFLFAINIFLSVRTGWVLLATGVPLVLWLNRRHLNYKKTLLIFLVLIGSVIMSYFSLTAVQNRISYMQRDLMIYFQKGHAGYSDADRIVSLKNGWEVFKEHPLLGVGSGDIRAAIDEHAISNNYQLPVKIPHNQFLYTAVCGGLVSLFLFCAGYFFSFFRRKHRSSALLLSFLLLFGITLLAEPTFETSVGVLMFVFCISMITRFDLEHAAEN